MSNIKIGLQLYSIRDKMEADMEKALAEVKRIGYDYVETAGTFGKSADEVRALLDKYGLKCISAHQGLEFYKKDFDSAVKFMKTVGAEYSAIPSWGRDLFVNDWDNTVKQFSEYGEKLANAGIKLLYHNHDYEFEGVDGECIIDRIFKAVPREFISPEFDTCWIKYASYEPTEYIKNYAPLEVVHLKDFWCKRLADGPVYQLISEGEDGVLPPADESRDFEFRTIGGGMQDIPAIMRACEEAGVKYAIVEQDNWHESDSLECAAKSREYLKKIGY